MADRQTIEIYQRQARQWVEARSAGGRPADDTDHVEWVEQARSGGPLVDIGCGPGWHLAATAPPAVALDPVPAMLDLVPHHAPGALRVRGLAEALPLAPGSIGGALANRVYLHLPAADVPLALAELHRVLVPDGPAFLVMMGDQSGREFRARGPFAGRLFSGWSVDRLRDVCHGAGLAIERLHVEERPGKPARLEVRVRRSFTLADTVGADMRLLICGLNPSIYSAEVGVGFGRPGNRFWPAALAAGLVTADRDPRRALLVDGIGMTDLVKRPTRRADELSPDEYRDGLARVERLLAWLRPAAVCFVGLAGWRLGVDRTAAAGWQPAPLGDTPVYLMPSTSGLNAHSRLDDLTDHLRAAGSPQK